MKSIFKKVISLVFIGLMATSIAHAHKITINIVTSKPVVGKHVKRIIVKKVVIKRAVKPKKIIHKRYIVKRFVRPMRPIPGRYVYFLPSFSFFHYAF